MNVKLDIPIETIVEALLSDEEILIETFSRIAMKVGSAEADIYGHFEVMAEKSNSTAKCYIKDLAEALGENGHQPA